MRHAVKCLHGQLARRDRFLVCEADISPFPLTHPFIRYSTILNVTEEHARCMDQTSALILQDDDSVEADYLWQTQSGP